MRPITTVDELEEMAAYGYASIRCNVLAEELQRMCDEIPGLPGTVRSNLDTAATLLRTVHRDIAAVSRARLDVSDQEL
jgi:hypothetical protein